MSKIRRIDVRLDRETFDVVLGTLSYMKNNMGDPNVLDFNRVMIDPEDINRFIAKLEERAPAESDSVTLPMDFSDWTVYYTLLLESSSKIPQENPRAYEILDDLVDLYGKMDRDELTPEGGL